MRVSPSVWLTALACAAAGCGQLGAEYKGMRLVSPSSIQPQNIERYPAGTPQRMILQWYRALQRSDDRTASGFYAPSVGVGPDQIRFERSSAYFAQAQPPRIIGVSVAGARATVFAVIAFRWAAPDGRGYLYTRPQAFELRLSRGAWQLTDNYFLLAGGHQVLSAPCSIC